MSYTPMLAEAKFLGPQEHHGPPAAYVERDRARPVFEQHRTGRT